MFHYTLSSFIKDVTVVAGVEHFFQLIGGYDTV
jgi:hypothetical protein